MGKFINKLKYFGQKIPEKMPEKVIQKNSKNIDSNDEVSSVEKKHKELSLTNSLSNRFESVINILYVINNICIIFGTLYFVLFIIDNSYNNFLIILVLISALILFLFNILQFGFFATLIRIRDGIENLNKN
tara:strand:- start:677 stop:1069 length:393 start_codon:yes stop_codon:yes gene_type:complete